MEHNDEVFERDLARLETLCFELADYASNSCGSDVSVALHRAHGLICEAARMQDEDHEAQA